LEIFNALPKALSASSSEVRTVGILCSVRTMFP
jgi:hypothetical protein